MAKSKETNKYDPFKQMNTMNKELRRRDVDPDDEGNPQNDDNSLKISAAESNDDSVYLDVSKIAENPLNKLSTDGYELLFDSIMDSGVIDPFIVYWDEETEKYVLLSGHRRFKAVQELLNDDSRSYSNRTVPCKIIKKPSSRDKEIEMLTQLDIHREDKDTINAKILNLLDAWKEKSRDEKKALSDKYKADYHKKYQKEKNEKYLLDPDGYVSANCKPLYEYVKRNAGLREDSSLSTIKRFIGRARQKNELTDNDINGTISEDENIEETIDDIVDTESSKAEINPDLIWIDKFAKTIKKTETASKALKKLFVDKKGLDEPSKYYQQELDNVKIGNVPIETYVEDEIIPALEKLATEIRQLNLTVDSMIKNETEN